MKMIKPVFLIFLSLKLHAQDKIIGRYLDYFGSQIQLNDDSTFKYTFHFDMESSWTRGLWKLQGDTVIFKMIPIYDTLLKSENDKITYSLILSTDETPELIPERNKNEVLSSADIGSLLSSIGQNKMTYPEKLVARKGRLYIIRDGELITKKQKGFWSRKKWPPWYFKVVD